MRQKSLYSHRRFERLSRRLMFTLLALIISLGAQAQSSSNPDSIAITGNTNWQLIKTTSQVKIYSKESNCDDTANGFFMKQVLLKVENLTSGVRHVSWNKKVYYDYNCHNCGRLGGENQSVITLSPNATETGTCGSSNLSIFIQMTGQGGQALTSFELTNLSIN